MCGLQGGGAGTSWRLWNRFLEIRRVQVAAPWPAKCVCVCVCVSVCLKKKTMRHWERIFNALGRRRRFLRKLNIHLRKHGDDSVILIQLMPHCSLWVVPGSQAISAEALLSVLLLFFRRVSVSGYDGSNCGSQGYPPLATRCMNIRDPSAPHIKKGSALQTFNTKTPPTTTTTHTIYTHWTTDSYRSSQEQLPLLDFLVFNWSYSCLYRTWDTSKNSEASNEDR